MQGSDTLWIEQTVKNLVQRIHDVIRRSHQVASPDGERRALTAEGCKAVARLEQLARNILEMVRQLRGGER